MPGGVRVAGATIAAGVVVNAAGHAAGRLSPRVPVRPVKGQILTLAPRADHPAPLRRMVRTPSCYLVPRPDGRVVVGATQEERGDRDVTAAGVFDLLEDALHIAPELAELRLAGTAAGLRPATADLARPSAPTTTAWCGPRADSGTACCCCRWPPRRSPRRRAATRVPERAISFDPRRFA